MKLSKYAIILASLSTIPLAHCETDCTNTQIPSAECNALLALFDSTDGASWDNNSEWNATNTPCNWHGVNCTNGHVTTMELGYNRLRGLIPSALGNLTHLKRLSLNNNQLSGSIPNKFKELNNLEYLWLSTNQLSGSIPEDLGNLTNLKELSLDNNQLSGSIPVQIGNLTNLVYLWLSSNQLSGSIPNELGNLSNLVYLWLSSNQLSGSIPDELGKLKKLKELSLDNNQLSGSIPTQLDKLKKLKYLYLNSNQLCGEIPVELMNLQIPSATNYLKLDNNHLSASAPKLIKWLNKRNPGWDTTQTPCPQGKCKLQFSSATYSITENGGQASITVTRTGDNNGVVSVSYATNDDTASGGSDYLQAIGSVNWADGDSNDKTITINIIDDGASENEEIFIVSLGNPTGDAELGSPHTAEVTIIDND